MIYKIFKNCEGIVSLVDEDDEITQSSHRDAGESELGEINSEAYEDEDEIWGDVLEQTQDVDAHDSF